MSSNAVKISKNVVKKKHSLIDNTILFSLISILLGLLVSFLVSLIHIGH